MKFDVSLGQVKQETPPSRNIYKANYDLIKSDLNDREWDELLTSSFEDDYKTFFDILRNLLDKYTPFKAKQVRKKNIYMTSKAMRLKNKKRSCGNVTLQVKATMTGKSTSAVKMTYGL